MSGILTDEGARFLLDVYMRDIIYGSLEVRLYKNAYVPDINSTIESFEEADFDGYDVRYAYPLYWSEPSTIDYLGLYKGKTEYFNIFFQLPYISWTCIGKGGDVWGYYALSWHQTSYKVLFAEYFDYKGMSKTDTLKLHPYVTLRGIQP